MANTPGNRAKICVNTANAAFRRGDIASAHRDLEQALALKNEAQMYSGPLWRENHRAFTDALLDSVVLYYKLGDFKQGDTLARQAQAWADDPNCSSQKNFELSFSVRKAKVWHFLSGLQGRFRSLLPAP